MFLVKKTSPTSTQVQVKDKNITVFKMKNKR
jgi:hypothetical protein